MIQKDHFRFLISNCHVCEQPLASLRLGHLVDFMFQAFILTSFHISIGLKIFKLFSTGFLNKKTDVKFKVTQILLNVLSVGEKIHVISSIFLYFTCFKYDFVLQLLIVLIIKPVI